MQLSRRVSSIQPSPTLALNAKADALRAQGVDIINFGAGQPDFPTPEHICQAAIKAINDGFTRYTPVPGTPELKQAIVDKFKRDNGLDYTTDQVMVNVGGKHSSYLIMQAVIDQGDEVIVPAPFWVSYPPMVILAGGKPVIVPTKLEDGFKLNLADLEAAVTDKTKAIFLNSPSNPTGSVYSAEELRPLVEFCAAKEILMISDEMYEPILFDGRSFTSTAAISPAAYEWTMTLNGVSKAYAMTGWRIGYMGGPVDIIKACSKIQSQSTSNPTSIAQKAAEEALNGPQEIVVEMNQSFERRRDLIMELIGELPQVSCYRPEGSFYAFPSFAAYYGKKAGDKVIGGSQDLADYLLEEASVAAVPGIAFGEDACIRFSFAISDAEIQKGMHQVREALAKLA
ncbi:MAG: pyridoxal phosphate-dependent aminotransferase [Desulfarculaceae bacterium]|nr:pyridoxal phosphate-dependent aminotransferase [Desulfarculaceae bacterium]MCF8072232.1 pyridoxal phosphate-dependent aminotransferase [Desulfarculaceae bacterium]MCF8100153.1 pyridoxal phosphate-dependent aminotransferase [Desulfarculaceae bacterium]MCF8117904.1 pyridoxal phosphate-dependent aminotransferase [Desulfarculaceae bacterium]